MNKKMIAYLIERLGERSTWTGLATAVSALFAINIPEGKVQAAFALATFFLGALTAGIRDNPKK